ncbi:hypothetical protein M5X11_17835 [Paenibacillus alginolyticus]|uniref:Uncharacterized protein n=1 Tax=Paenibacillus alginolyticus TaxID=59839 RepID=A0ABT4GHA6_9BACL|nr:hypothetical protein [Paenibacillus alginolyticus]MCY9666768.1 hypothetical protein [Paenibacillus alginolyticus]MCY9695454.1 hypothetical protein [Paenibacillus alginolyticus]MEC0146315.1 hypothetical protein [Paenibacillus alginolyticus]
MEQRWNRERSIFATDAAIPCTTPKASSLNTGILITPFISVGATPAAGGEKWWRSGV